MYAQFDLGPFLRGIFIRCSYSHDSHHTSHVPSRTFRFYALISSSKSYECWADCKIICPRGKRFLVGFDFRKLRALVNSWDDTSSHRLATLFKRLRREGRRRGKYSPATNSRINCVRDRQTVIPNRTKEKPRPHSRPKPPLHRQCKHLDIYSGERKWRKVLASVSDNPQTVDGIYMCQKKLFFEKGNSKEWSN